MHSDNSIAKNIIRVSIVLASIFCLKILQEFVIISIKETFDVYEPLFVVIHRQVVIKCIVMLNYTATQWLLVNHKIGIPSPDSLSSN